MPNVVTPEGRVVWAQVFTPQKYDANDPNSKLSYSVAMVFEKGTDISKLTAAATQILTEKFGADQTKWPVPMKTPFRRCKERWKVVDGKQIIPPGYEDPDAIFMTFNADASKGPPPGVVDENVNRILDQSKFYSGCYAFVDCGPFWYETKGNKGISFGLNNVQKIRDGERIGGGRPQPEASFKAVGGQPGTSSAGGAATAGGIFGV